MEAVREFRDIPRWVAESYILELQGSTQTDAGFNGPDWEITIDELSPVPVGFLSFRRIRIAVRGAPERVHAIWRELAPKFYRGGA